MKKIKAKPTQKTHTGTKFTNFMMNMASFSVFRVIWSISTDLNKIRDYKYINVYFKNRRHTSSNQKIGNKIGFIFLIKLK